MNWTKFIYVLIIVLIYIPMVFLGANVFFPKYTGNDRYYQGDDCYRQYPAPERLPGGELPERDADFEQCQLDSKAARDQYEQEKNAYEGNKYFFMSLFSVIVLLVAMFVPKIQDSVSMGLFLGAIATTFFSTWIYFDSNSKLGFAVLVVIFFLTLFFINRKKDSFLPKKKK